MKKIFFVAALLCASMMSFAIDWSEVAWLDNGVGPGYDQKYKAVVNPAMGGGAEGFINNIQMYNSIPVMHVCFPSALFGECSLDASLYTIPENSAAGFFHLAAFTEGENEFTIVCNSVTYTFNVYYAGTSTGLESVATNAKAVKTVENGQLYLMYNGTKYDVQGKLVK